MFDIGWGELVVIGIVALIAIGPKELPTVLRTLGQYMGKVRRMASEFQGQFQEAMREAEMADLKKQAEDIKELGQRSRQFRSAGGHPEGDRERLRRQPAKPELAKPTRIAGARIAAPSKALPEAGATAADRRRRCRCSRRRSARKILRLPKRRRPSRPGARHEPRGYRGHQGAVDGSPDRAAFAADQGVDRIRRDVRDLLRVREGHLQCSGVAVRMGRRTGKFEIHLHCAARIFHHAAQARDVRRSFPVISRWWRRRFTCSLRRGFIVTSARPFCRI